MERNLFLIFFLLFEIAFLGSCAPNFPYEEKGSTVEEYCLKFTLKYAENKNSVYKDKSILVKENILTNPYLWIANRFYSKGQKFIAVYECAFSVSKNSEEKNLKVDILLVETRKFAEFTQWADKNSSLFTQIIPISYVYRNIDQKSGYGVFKFLKTLGK